MYKNIENYTLNSINVMIENYKSRLKENNNKDLNHPGLIININ